MLKLSRDRRLEAFNAPLALLTRNLLSRVWKLQLCNPAPMRSRPARAADVADLVAQEQRLQPLARLALHAHRVLPRAYQVAHRLVERVRHIDRLELACTCKS